MTAPRPRIVIVDRHPRSRRITRTFFTMFDYDVVGEADSAALALALVAQEHPDVVVVDIDADDGFALARALTRAHRSVTVLLTSADEPVPLERLADSGASGLLPKPRLPRVGVTTLA